MYKFQKNKAELYNLHPCLIEIMQILLMYRPASAGGEVSLEASSPPAEAGGDIRRSLNSL